VWHLLRETPGFLGFASPNAPPEPMGPAEVEALLRRVDAPVVEPTPTFDLAPGEYVRVTEGSLAGLEGTVDQVQPEKGVVRVLLLVFGRSTPVDLEHGRVERVDG
jgi:transcriptional antiterminator NusG